MKKVIALLLATALLLGMLGCGATAEMSAISSDVLNGAPAPEPAATPKPTVIEDSGMESVLDAPEKPMEPVITGVMIRVKDRDYVDSALYSQYEAVTFSDGSIQRIDVDEETFVLVLDDTIVDLGDPVNWVPEAELYTVEKGQYDTVTMAMNDANWGPFYFTGAVDFDGGEVYGEPFCTCGGEGSRNYGFRYPWR